MLSFLKNEKSLFTLCDMKKVYLTERVVVYPTFFRFFSSFYRIPKSFSSSVRKTLHFLVFPPYFAVDAFRYSWERRVFSHRLITRRVLRHLVTSYFWQPPRTWEPIDKNGDEQILCLKGPCCENIEHLFCALRIFVIKNSFRTNMIDVQHQWKWTSFNERSEQKLGVMYQLLLVTFHKRYPRALGMD